MGTEMADPNARKSARVWLPPAPSRSLPVMANGHRDPEVVGYEWAAWWALQGDEPLARVRDCAVDLEHRLGQLGADLHRRQEFDGDEIVAAAHLFMIALTELLDENGTSEFKATISRRKRGKPINKHERALVGHRAAGIVRRLVSEGWKQEAALQQAKQETGLSRAETMVWLRIERAFFAGAIPPMPSAVQKLLEPYKQLDGNSANSQD